jgi:peptide/nickel transport system permease protein
MQIGLAAATGLHRRLAVSLLGLIRFSKAKPLGALGLLFITIAIALAAFGPLVAPYSYDEFSIPDRLQGPSFSHPFGTDEQGRDIFSRVIYGARTSITIALSAVAISMATATIIGVVSGYYRGKVDSLIQRIVDINLAFPGLIFIIFLISVFGNGNTVLIVSLGVVFSASATRLVRGQTLSVSNLAYIEAARSLGCSDRRIMFRHIVPNVAFIVLVAGSIQVGAIILVESSLSFLGLGTLPPYPSWGRMLQDAQAQMRDHPHLALFPGLAIVFTVWGLNMLGDALRDWWDPRMRGTR